ncbi:cytidine deaminase [Planktosalinus lacus]|uniref:Cytidine deaminase n=1 Tax=Planktosalinus lacus TaxID=1526573 RepID=A0A8J2V910_9FLAO|nr:cytidine deaminase [Planktosalinus lacus]GGD87005.1 cytidine deaminase [Planktosalinus lacus]
MKQLEIQTKLTIYNSKEALSETTRSLFLEAEKARERAYAPYSHFRVGAALLLDNGEVITGNNQENAAYPSGLCAERVAVFYANAQYPQNKIIQLVVTARSEKQEIKEPISPCGSCRQAIAEYEIKQNQPIEIYFMGETGNIYKTDSIKELLPLLFDKKHLD